MCLENVFLVFFFFLKAFSPTFFFKRVTKHREARVHLICFCYFVILFLFLGLTSLVPNSLTPILAKHPERKAGINEEMSIGELGIKEKIPILFLKTRYTSKRHLVAFRNDAVL